VVLAGASGLQQLWKRTQKQGSEKADTARKACITKIWKKGVIFNGFPSWLQKGAKDLTLHPHSGETTHSPADRLPQR